MLQGKVTWNSSCSWGRLPGTAPAPGKGYLEQLTLLEKVTWGGSCGKITWNTSCSLGYLEQLMPLEKVTWSGSCLCGEGSQFQPRKEKETFFNAVCTLNSNNL
jgi:hypothetical protein